MYKLTAGMGDVNYRPKNMNGWSMKSGGTNEVFDAHWSRERAKNFLTCSFLLVQPLTSVF